MADEINKAKVAGGVPAIIATVKAVSDEMGLLAMEIEGARDDIDRAITWLREQGVTVEPIEKNIIE